MFLCYKCYSRHTKEDKWDDFHCDPELKKTCEDCGLYGVYVREIKEEG